jgi:hypothetical protein
MELIVDISEQEWLAENIGADLADLDHIKRLREELIEEAVTGSDFIDSAARS